MPRSFFLTWQTENRIASDPVFTTIIRATPYWFSLRYQARYYAVCVAHIILTMTLGIGSVIPIAQTRELRHRKAK